MLPDIGNEGLTDRRITMVKNMSSQASTIQSLETQVKLKLPRESKNCNKLKEASWILLHQGALITNTMMLLIDKTEFYWSILEEKDPKVLGDKWKVTLFKIACRKL